MNKKTLIIIGAIIAVLGVGLVVKNMLKSEPVAEEPALKKKKISEPLNIIDTSERPYVYISPNSDGRNITISVDSVKKEASDVDYELEYQSGSLLQGVFGSIDLGSLPASTKQLLGSCSAGGSCTYHEDVTGGQLTTRFNGSENYALKSDWKYIENTEDEGAFSSKDAKFQISSADLEKVNIAVIFNSPGFPEELDFEVVSDPYSFQTTPAITGQAELTMRANTEGNLVIMGWDGTEWLEFEGEVDGKSITAEVDVLELYLVAVK